MVIVAGVQMPAESFNVTLADVVGTGPERYATPLDDAVGKDHDEVPNVGVNEVPVVSRVTVVGTYGPPVQTTLNMSEEVKLVPE
jgi:hypothetical protein